MLDSRSAFIPLVDVFEQTIKKRLSRTPFSIAERVFSLFPGQANALTLKRDLLGVDREQSSLVPRVSAVDLLRLVLKFSSDDLSASGEDVLKAIACVDATESVELLFEIADHKIELADLYLPLMDVLIDRTSIEEIESGRLPLPIMAEALQRRPDFITSKSASLLAVGDIIHLIQEGEDTVLPLYAALFRHELNSDSRHVIENSPAPVLALATEAALNGYLDDSWKVAFRSEPLRYFNNTQVSQLISADQIFVAADLLDYPNSAEALSIWNEAIIRTRTIIRDDSRTLTFFSYLTGLALVYHYADPQQIISTIFPIIWKKMRNSDLPLAASSLLSMTLSTSDTPDSISKEVLKKLRRIRRDGKNVDTIVSQMGLTDRETAYVYDLNKSKERSGEKEANIFQVFNPFAYWPWN